MIKRVSGLFVVSLLISIPLFSVLILSFFPEQPVFKHLWETVLPGYLVKTVLLMGGVGLGAFFLGVMTAGLVSFFDFPGKRFFQRFLILPLAVPGYVMANVYLQVFEYSGPFQAYLRKVFGWKNVEDYWFPEVASLEGAIFVLSFVLFPYIFIMARSAFMEQSFRYLEVARSLGRSPWSSFLSVIIPLARPSLMVGLGLVLMETAADFGTVHFFGVPTLTTGIYTVWLQMNNVGGAAQLASFLLSFMCIFVVLEKSSRIRKKYYQTQGTILKKAPRRLKGQYGYFAFLACAIPFCIGFLIPFLFLSIWTVQTWKKTLVMRFLEDLGNTLFLGAIGGILCVIVALFMAYGKRGMKKNILVRSFVSFSTLGYAIPGPVLALGVLLPLAKFDNTLDAFLKHNFNFSVGLLLSGTVVSLLFAYLVRFIILSYGPIETGLLRITPRMDEVCQQFGLSMREKMKRVHLPLLRKSLASALILVFVDIMKELPATLMLRPFNFNTLATRLYEYTSDEMLRESSLWAVTIVLAGLIPLIIFNYHFEKEQGGPLEKNS